MKKFWTIFITFILGIVVGIGGYLGVKKLTEPSKTELNLIVKVMHLENEYKVGDDVIYNVLVFSDVKLVRLTYVVDNGQEIDIKSAEHGKSEDHDMFDEKFGEFVIDSKIQTLKTVEMNEGFHSIIFYAYDSENVLVEIMEEPIQFRLIAQSA